jgi:hypothetical protein
MCWIEWLSRAGSGCRGGASELDAQDDGPEREFGPALASVVLMLVFFACLAPVFFNRPPLALGLVERMLLGALMGWLWVIGSSPAGSGA